MLAERTIIGIFAVLLMLSAGGVILFHCYNRQEKRIAALEKRITKQTNLLGLLLLAGLAITACSAGKGDGIAAVSSVVPSSDESVCVNDDESGCSAPLVAPYRKSAATQGTMM